MDEIELKVYLENIPNGRLRELIGQSICDAIVHYNIYNKNLAFDYVEILQNKFGKNILFDSSVFRELIVFLDDANVRAIAESNNLKFKDVEDARGLISEMSFNYKRYGFSESIIRILRLNKDKYFPDQVEIVEDFEPLIEPDYNLHPYQKHLKDKVIQNLLNPAYTDKMLVHMPTGAGKTKTAMEIISDYLRCKPVLGGFDNSAFIVWLAHSKELCDQAVETFARTWRLRGDYPIDIFKIYGDNEFDEGIISSQRAFLFVGFQKFNSLIRSSGALQKRIKQRVLEKVRLVVVDEAHKSLADTYEKAISLLTENSAGVQLVGLTATPGRSGAGQSSNNHLAQFFNSTKIGLVDDLGVPISKPIEYLQELGVLAKIDRQELVTDIEVKLNVAQIKNLKMFGDEKLNEILNGLAINPARNKLIIDKVKILIEHNESTLVFACNVEHCIILQTLLKAEGIDAGTVLSSTAKIDREKAINSFKSGDLKVLINYGVLTTGFDAPNLNALIIARPTTSIVLYSQMVGRALRGEKNGGHERNKLIDLKDNFGLGNESEMFNFYDEIWNY
jgi:superfamily II DNA or RNA helicase